MPSDGTTRLVFYESKNVASSFQETTWLSLQTVKAVAIVMATLESKSQDWVKTQIKLGFVSGLSKQQSHRCIPASYSLLPVFVTMLQVLLCGRDNRLQNSLARIWACGESCWGCGWRNLRNISISVYVKQCTYIAWVRSGSSILLQGCSVFRWWILCDTRNQEEGEEMKSLWKDVIGFILFFFFRSVIFALE